MAANLANNARELPWEPALTVRDLIGFVLSACPEHRSGRSCWSPQSAGRGHASALE